MPGATRLALHLAAAGGAITAALAAAGAAAAAEAPEAALPADDECGADETCALNALQMRSARKAAAAQEQALQGMGREVADMSAEELEGLRNYAMENATGVWHYSLPCWNSCQGKAGFCESYCGPGNACCKYAGSSNDPSECHDVRFWPVMSWYTCVDTRLVKGDANKPIGEATGPAKLIYDDPALMRPSDAPTHTFYMYRVQSSQDYDPENQNMGSLAGMLWYLHHEIVWHPKLQRSGSFFSSPKTRIERFKVSTKATQPLHDLGMNFGPVNAFDLTRCTGPYECSNFKSYGYTVGCEDWKGGAASFPHGQWTGLNKYPGAVWYSLPGPCSTMGIGKKTAQCIVDEPGGACRNTDTPTGTGDCTYTYQKVGEISLNELEGLEDPDAFKAMGGSEYDVNADKGQGMDFWDGMKDEAKNQERINKAMQMFRDKFPDQPDLADPGCDFNQYTFYKKSS